MPLNRSPSPRLNTSSSAEHSLRRLKRPMGLRMFGQTAACIAHWCMILAGLLPVRGRLMGFATPTRRKPRGTPESRLQHLRKRVVSRVPQQQIYELCLHNPRQFPDTVKSRLIRRLFRSQLIQRISADLPGSQSCRCAGSQARAFGGPCCSKLLGLASHRSQRDSRHHR